MMSQRRRCVVLEDGSAIGCYQRNVHETHTVVLESSGHAYSYIQPDGTRTRHLTPTALSSHRPLVVDTLDLRNRFSDQPSYLHVRLMQAKDVRQQRRIRALRARWPASGGSVKVSRLYNEQERCFELQSIEGAAKVQLHASGKLVELQYVAEVKVSDDRIEDSSHAHYATLRQTFAVGHTPQSFELPVRMLLAAKAAWDKDREAEIELAAVDGEEGVSGAVSQLPRNGAFAARPAFSVIASTNNGVAGGRGIHPRNLWFKWVVNVHCWWGPMGFTREYVLQAFKCPAEARSHDPPSSPLQKEELELVEESENEHGRFRAFRDGRVRVAFADRTILQVERDGDCCSFFFADGSSTQTTLASAPLRHRAYIYQALEFGDWAFSPQDERMQRHVKRQEVEAIVAQELQRINVRCSMNSQQEIIQQKCTKDTTVRKDQDDTDRKDMTLSLSLAAVRELQAATLQHIASVDHVLQMAASAAANDA
ncbi:uncharacterized protein IUM83_06583 [Phytophthora cinnamomi]|uniref:uncharacterized protein n=1 Tax=Phytophthora cinnamomi TaxID=4785 RepID=UPI003559536B|nr:hypothetical protein IUM83_06583 [Phytophthora cinnamomi]